MQSILSFNINANVKNINDFIDRKFANTYDIQPLEETKTEEQKKSKKRNLEKTKGQDKEMRTKKQPIKKQIIGQIITRSSKNKHQLPDLLFFQEVSFSNDSYLDVGIKVNCTIEWPNITGLDIIKYEPNTKDKFITLFKEQNNITENNKQLKVQLYEYNNYNIVRNIYIGQLDTYKKDMKVYTDFKDKQVYSTHTLSYVKKNYKIEHVYFYIVNVRPIVGIQIGGVIYLNIHMMSAPKRIGFLQQILNILVNHLKLKNNKFMIIGDFNMDLNEKKITNYITNLDIKYIEPKKRTHKKNNTKLDYIVHNIDTISGENIGLINYDDRIDHIPQLFIFTNKQKGGAYYNKYIKYKSKYLAILKKIDK